MALRVRYGRRRCCGPARLRARSAPWQTSPPRHWVIGLSGAGALALIAYGGLSAAIAAWRVAPPRRPVVGSPADESLAYHAVAFHSRGDRLLLRGWFIPGVLSGSGRPRGGALMRGPGLRWARPTGKRTASRARPTSPVWWPSSTHRCSHRPREPAVLAIRSLGWRSLARRTRDTTG